MPPDADPTPSQPDGQSPKRRWYRPTPDRLLIALPRNAEGVEHRSPGSRSAPRGNGADR